jgi:hypothetical protein
MSTARNNLGGAGTQTAALFWWLCTEATRILQNLGMELTWTEVNDLNTARNVNTGVFQTATH